MPGGNAAGGRRVLVMVKLKTSVYTAWIRGYVSGSKTPTIYQEAEHRFCTQFVCQLGEKEGLLSVTTECCVEFVRQQLSELQSPDVSSCEGAEQRVVTSRRDLQ